jgi:outer membrane immunogenic protein
MKVLRYAAGMTMLCLANSAFAADPHVFKGPLVAPPAPVTWNHCYVDLLIGYGWNDRGHENGGYTNLGRNSQIYQSPETPFFIQGQGSNVPAPAFWPGGEGFGSGVVGGGAWGCNRRIGQYLVASVETDFLGSGIGQRSQSVIPRADGGLFVPGPNVAAQAIGPHVTTVDVNNNLEFYGTGRFRLGIPLFERFLVFGGAGFAYGQVTQSVNVVDAFIRRAAWGNATTSQTKFGYAVGGGVEYLPPQYPNFSVKVEYLYIDLGKITTTGVGYGSIGVGDAPFAFTQTANARFHTVRCGVNYHFDPPNVAGLLGTWAY